MDYLVKYLNKRFSVAMPGVSADRWPFPPKQPESEEMRILRETGGVFIYEDAYVREVSPLRREVPPDSSNNI